MVHALLIAALALFVLWIIGLGSAWTAGTSWTLFVLASVLLVAWAVAGFGGRRRAA
ncbi:MAG: hypothetical protein JST54_18775 [Deltaproteobacteria bacterium]|nr:hypothetical protein [Deltaproteobacteria bacterium]